MLYLYIQKTKIKKGGLMTDLTDHSIRILWVDDEIELLDPFVQILTQRGFTVYPVSSADEGIGMLHTGFDLVISDMNMPGKNGLEFLRAIRDRDRALDVHTPVILVAYTSTRIENYLKDGFDDVYVKAIRIDGLIQKIRKILEKSS